MNEGEGDTRPRYDPYYRDFPSNALPVRTPFTRSGRNDAGYVFFYLTHKKPNWSLLLEKSRMEYIYAEADLRIPRDFTQFLLLEKRYSTRTLQSKARRTSYPRSIAPLAEQETLDPDSGSSSSSTNSVSNTLVVLREPDLVLTKQSDIVSYHLREDEAIVAADAYTRKNNRRTLVGLLLWDERWY